jgi:hypothetical protein
MDGAVQLESERAVFDKCNEYWSILCPGYNHKGSGWFRIRYIYAALGKSILVADEEDLSALDIKKVNIEELTHEELVDYSEYQANKIIKWMWTKEKFDEQINKIVTSL